MVQNAVRAKQIFKRVDSVLPPEEQLENILLRPLDAVLLSELHAHAQTLVTHTCFSSPESLRQFVF